LLERGEGVPIPKYIKKAIAEAEDMAANDDFVWGNASPLKKFDYVKRGLNTVAEKAIRKGDNSRVASALKLKRQLTDVLDENENYKAARFKWADDSEIINSAEMGRKLFGGDFDKLEDAVIDMSPPQMEAFKMGAIRAIREKLEKGNIRTSDAKKLLKSKETINRIKLAFDNPSKFRRFMRDMENEITFTDVKNDVLGGPKTAERLRAKGLIEGTLINPESLSKVGILSGDPLYTAADVATKALGKRKPSPEMIQAIADRLLQKNITRDEIKRLMAGDNIQLSPEQWQRVFGGMGTAGAVGLLQ
jgi:hypothetical protein